MLFKLEDIKEPEEPIYKVGELVALKSNPQIALTVVGGSASTIVCLCLNKHKRIERHTFHSDCLAPFEGSMLKLKEQTIKKIKQKPRKPRALKA